ncbi:MULTISPECIES: hypothetical protein [Microbacterium]|uniref:hypothetical protein n=1 Tax=Microbacterium TaxID=33882 RepID=UPI00046A287E|nr:MULTISPECIES: hypothetical protein [Microbacterium]AMG84326.1 hypothetical protein AXH82_13650 [Microbacterium sp. PAMC 28756]QXE31221.1 hypothetical protein IZR02_07005 [Microbacterium paraoxydans]
MTNENPWQQLLDQLPENASITRGLVENIRESTTDGLVGPMDMSVALVGAVVQLERRILALEGDGEAEISGGGIPVFDPDDRPWER